MKKYFDIKSCVVYVLLKYTYTSFCLIYFNPSRHTYGNNIILEKHALMPLEHEFHCYTVNQHRNCNSNIGLVIKIYLHTDLVGLNICVYGQLVNLPKRKVIAVMEFASYAHETTGLMRIRRLLLHFLWKSITYIYLILIYWMLYLNRYVQRNDFNLDYIFYTVYIIVNHYRLRDGYILQLFVIFILINYILIFYKNIPLNA